MKVLLEIPDKFFEHAKFIILGACTKAEDEQAVIEIAEKVKTMEEPVFIDMADIYDKESEAAQYSHFNIALAAAAMHALLKEPKQEEKPKSGLVERLEQMQKQAEELQ